MSTVAISLLVPRCVLESSRGSQDGFTKIINIFQAQTGLFIDSRMPLPDPPVDPSTLWFCGHCHHGPMSKRDVSECEYCLRQKDYSAYSQRIPTPPKRRNATLNQLGSLQNNPKIENHTEDHHHNHSLRRSEDSDRRLREHHEALKNSSSPPSQSELPTASPALLYLLGPAAREPEHLRQGAQRNAAAVPSATDSEQSLKSRMSRKGFEEDSGNQSQERSMSSLHSSFRNSKRSLQSRKGIDNNSISYDVYNATIAPLALDWPEGLDDSTEVDARFELDKSVMVKSIRDKGDSQDRKEAQNPAGLLKTIRHPHFVAQLGSFTHSNHLHILISPKVGCSLKELMDSVVVTIKEQQQSKIASNLLKTDNSNKNRFLYKDIDSDDILVDESESVFSTGARERGSQISRLKSFSRGLFYGFSERSRGRPVSMFILGCVLLELEATRLVARHDILRFNGLCRSKNDRRPDLDLINEWIDTLEQSAPTYKNKKDSPLVREVRMIGALPTIRGILDAEPKQKPEAHGLWEIFKSVSLEICADCDPRHPDVWRPRALSSSETANTNSSVQSANNVNQEFPKTPLIRKSSLSQATPKRVGTSSLTNLDKKHVQSSQSILPENKPVSTDVMTPFTEGNAKEEPKHKRHRRSFTDLEKAQINAVRKDGACKSCRDGKRRVNHRTHGMILSHCLLTVGSAFM